MEYFTVTITSFEHPLIKDHIFTTCWHPKGIPHISHFFPHTHFRPGNFSPQNYTGGLEYFGTFRINCQKIPLTSDT